jgi:hypothetical protein
VERNPFEAPQIESRRPPSRAARQMRATMVIFAIVLLAVVAFVLLVA